MKKRKILSVISVVLCLVSLFTMTGEAYMRSNFGTYQDKYIPTPDAYSCGSTQAFGVDPYSEYVYSIKVNNDDSQAVIYRANRNRAGSAEVLWNSSNNSYNVSYLGHANDMCVTNVNGKTILYVATASSKDDDLDIVGLQIHGNSYSYFCGLTVDLNNNGSYGDSIQGLTIADHNYCGGTRTQFLAKSGNNIYKFSLLKSDNRYKDTPQKMFTLKRNTVCVTRHDTRVEEWMDISESRFNAQGIDYCAENNTLYLTLNGKANLSESIIVAYKYTRPTDTGTKYPSGVLSFYIKSNTYAALFGIEGAGIAPDGKLYFNTNRRKSSTSRNHDLISYIKDYNIYTY